MLNLCHFCHLWHKWQKHVCIHANLKTSLQYCIFYQRLFKAAQGNFSPFPCIHKCVPATCAINGRSGTNLTMAIPQPEIIQMIRKLGSRVIHRCGLQICNQISQINNNLFVIRCTIFNWLINKLIN